MKPRVIDTPPQEDLFRSRLENIVSLCHPLVKLADSIDWAHLNGVLGEFCEEAIVGQPLMPCWSAGWSHRIFSISVARPSFRTNRRCISKGKAHKRYEFGVEVGIVTALNRPFVLAAHALPNNPCDGHTLVWSLAHTRINTGVPLKTVVVDKGYRGPQVGWPGVEIVRPGQRSRDAAHRRWRRSRLRRRSLVEALIGHMKNEGYWIETGSKGHSVTPSMCCCVPPVRICV